MSDWVRFNSNVVNDDLPRIEQGTEMAVGKPFKRAGCDIKVGDTMVVAAISDHDPNFEGTHLEGKTLIMFDVWHQPDDDGFIGSKTFLELSDMMGLLTDGSLVNTGAKGKNFSGKAS